MNIVRICYVIACMCVAAQTAGASDGLAIVSEIVPTRYGELSAEEKTAVLGEIAESGFRLLMNVPQRGLKVSRADVDRIIAARKWLEGTNNVSAAVLAILLQYGVDSCVLNELYRSERARAGAEVVPPFVADSFDEGLVTSILQSNAIDEAERIAFALSLETNVGSFCREHGLKAADFLNGTAFDRYEKQLTIGEIKSRLVHPDLGTEQEIVFLEDATPLTSPSLDSVLLFAKAIVSVEALTKLYLPMQLDSMNIARDVRLFVSVFWKYGGLGDLDEISDGNILHGKLLKDRLVKEVAKDVKGHTSGRSRPGSMLMAHERTMTERMRVIDIIGRVGSRCDSFYANVLALNFRCFVRSADIFPFKYREPMVHAGTGVWLGLK